MNNCRNEQDGSPPPSIIGGEENLPPVLGSATMTHTLRPDSASSEDYLSSSSSGMETGIRRTRNRKTWRQSLQEQDDEIDLLSVGDWQAKCKTLQSMVHKLQDNLLMVNTECTRLQNNQIQAQQTKTQSELECKKLQWENERLTVQLNLTNEETTRLRESCQESDINVIKMRNELLNAKTEVGKAARELEMVKRNSMDHTDCIATEERLMGTVAAIKKELNHLRDDVANLTDKAHKRGRTIKEWESKAQEKDILIQQLEEKIKKGTSEMVEENSSAESNNVPLENSSNHLQWEATEKHLKERADHLQQDINTMESHMDTWFSQLQEMNKFCTNERPTDAQSWSDLGTQMKSATLGSLLHEVSEQVKEEVEYSKQLSIFCKESTLKLATAMNKDISFADGAESGFKMAVDLVEHACGTIGKVQEEPEENGTAKQDELHGRLDRWIVDASAVKSTCSERTFMTVSHSFVPDTFQDKMEYFSDMMQSLPEYVSNGFDRLEDDSKRTITSLRDKLQLYNELREQMRDFLTKIDLSPSSSDPASALAAIEQAFEEASSKCQNSSASEELRMQINELTKEKDEQGIRIKELETLAVPSDMSEKNAALVEGLKEIHMLYEKKLTTMEKFSELQVEFVANGLNEGDPQAAELKAMQDHITIITTEIDEKEKTTMGLVESLATVGINQSTSALETSSGDHSLGQTTEISLNKLVESLRDQLKELGEKLTETAAEKSKVEEKLQEAIENSSQGVEDTIVDHSNYEETEKSLNEMIATLNEELSKVNTSKEELSSELLDKDQAFRQQEEKLTESEAAKLKLEERLKEVIESSSQELVSITIANSQCHVNEKVLNESIVTLKEEMTTTTDHVAELTKNLQEKEDVIQNLEEKLTNATSKLKESEEVIGDSVSTEERQSAEIKKVSGEYNEEIMTIKAQLDALVEEKSQWKEDLAAKEAFIGKQNHDLAHLRDELHQDAQCQLELNTTIEMLNQKLQEAEGKLSVIQAENTITESVENSDNSMVTTLEERIEVLQKELETERQQHEEILAVKIEEHSAHIGTSVTDHQNELSSLRSEIDALNVRVETKEETEIIKTLTEKLEAAEALNVSLKAENTITESVENSDNSMVITFEERIEVLQKELETERQQHEKILADKIEEHSANMATSVTDHQNELSSLRSEIDALNVRLETKGETEIIKTLTEKLEATEALNVSLKVEVDGIRENLASANATTVTDFEAREAAFAEQCVNLRAEVQQLIILLGGKDKEIAQYAEQVKQHAVTIVAIEERLNQVIEKNKQYREDIEKQNLEIRDYKLTLEEYGKRQVEHVTIVSDASSSSSSNQSLTRLRKENASLRNQTEQSQKVISALRRDIAGLGARLGDVTGDIEEATKRELDEKRIKLTDADRELATHKAKVKSLFTVIDEKLAETKRLTTEVHKLKEAVIKLKNLVKERDEHVKTLQDKLDKGQQEKEKMKTEFDEQGRITKELAAHGATCRGERHVEVIANQRAALTELRTQIRDLELWPRPVPTHEAALQQVMVLKKELSELRVRESLSHTLPSAVQHISTLATTTESIIEKSAHLITMETLDMSENSYLALLRAVSTSLEIEEVAGLRRLSHIPADEQLKLFREREQSCAIISNRVTLLRERLKRKEELLSGYEQDLAKLHRLEEVSGVQEEQVNNLTHEIRQRTEESQCLRVSLERARLRTDPNRRYVSAVHEQKLPALHHHHTHCVPLDPLTAKTQAAKGRNATELMKKKNYEIQTLRTELGRKDHQLDKYKRTMSNREKTPVPPSGRPSSARVRRPRSAVKPKRPASAKLQSTTTMSAARRSPSPPHSSRTPRELLEENYQVISSTDDIKNTLGEIVADEVQVKTSESFREGGLNEAMAAEQRLAEAATSFMTSEIASSMTSTGAGKVSFMTETKTEETESDNF